MPFEISAALSKKRVLHTEIQLEDVSGTIPLDYYPNMVDEAIAALKSIQAQRSPESYPQMEAIFLSLVAAWDVVYEGQPVLLTPDGLASIGMTSAILADLIAGVIGEAYAGEVKGTRLSRRLPNS